MKGGKAERTSETFSQSTVEIVPETNLLLNFSTIQANKFTFLLNLGFDLHFLLLATKKLLTNTWISYYGFCEDYSLAQSFVYKYYLK